MHHYQVAIICFLVALLIFRASRFGAFIILLELFIYYSFIIDLQANLYYSCTASINIVVGFILHNNYKRAALCSYALVYANLYGFYIWYQYIDPVSYDIISGVLLILQVVFLLPNGVTRGTRYNLKYFMAKLASFDSFQSRGTMHKTKDKKTQK